MTPLYLGVDVAGKNNTWMAALSSIDGALNVVEGPYVATLEEIVAYCEERDVSAVAIDAQLTMALSENNGFRTSDQDLIELLPEDCQNWVMSINSLAAVPIRGRLLADGLSSIVGTILETHPRASLLFGLEHHEQEIATPVRHYKRKSRDTRAKIEVREEHTRTLWRYWSERFDFSPSEDVSHDGALDSIVCATVAYLFHHAPAMLYKLRHQVPHKMGRGPFYILAPDAGLDTVVG